MVLFWFKVPALLLLCGALLGAGFPKPAAKRMLESAVQFDPAPVGTSLTVSGIRYLDLGVGITEHNINHLATLALCFGDQMYPPSVSCRMVCS